jgi:hypothetical protein
MSAETAQETWLKLEAMNGDDDEQLSPTDLAGYARQKAMEVVLDNWQAALRDGEALSELVKDLDDLVADVRTFKTAVEERFADELIPSSALQA